MADVLRWGRSAYETDDALAAERAGAEALGLSWACQEALTPAPDLTGVRALVVTSKVAVNADVVARFDGDLILTTTSGYDHIDLDACRSKRVVAARCPVARRDAVVEYALAAAMWLMRRSPVLDREARQGRWCRADLPDLAPVGLSGACVAIVGCGVIGTRMAEVCQALGARVVGVDPAGVPAGVQGMSLADALAQADVVTLHCPLNEQTRGMMDAAAMRAMKPTAVLINAARGTVLDVSVAVSRVREGRLRGLAVDVFPVEPYPSLARETEGVGVFFSPHSAGYTADLGQRVAREVSDTLRRWHAGESLPTALT